MIGNNAIKKYLIPVLVVFAALLFFKPMSVAADDGETITLTGTIDDVVTIDAGVSKLILDGVTQSSDGEIRCEGNIRIEIKDGTTNKTGVISITGAARFTGGGDLECSTILFLGSASSFDHSGNISIPNGMIAAISGDIYINSGTITINSPEEYGFAIMAYKGDVQVNGGNVKADGEYWGIYAYDTIALYGGDVEASGNEGYAFSAGSSEGGGLVMSDEMKQSTGIEPVEVESTEEGVSVYTIRKTDGDVLQEASMEAPADLGKITEAQKIVAAAMSDTGESTEGETEGTDEYETTPLDVEEAESGSDDSESAADNEIEMQTVETTESVSAESEDTETASEASDTASKQQGKSHTTLILVIVFIAIAVAAGALAAVNGRKKHDKKGKK